MANRADFTVRLIDNVKGPASSAARALGKLTDRFRKTSGPVKDMSGRLREASGRMREAAEVTRKAGGALDVFKGSLLASATTKVLGLATSAVAAGGEMVTFGQNARMAFSQLAKHGAEPEKMFEHSRALAKRFGLDVMDTTKQYQKFLALQFDPASADRMLRMGADLRALGNSAEGVQGVFMALGQIKGKGRLQGEEMLQLAERGVSTVLVQEEIGKLMGGKTSQEVQKLQQAGKVTADVGLKAIENAINRKLGQTSLGQTGAKFADTTIDGMIGRFKALGQDAGLTAVDKMTAPLTKIAGKGLDAFESFISSPKGAEVMGKIAGALGRAADFAVILFDSFGAGFGDSWKALGDGIAPVLEAFAGGDGSTTVGLVKALGKGLGQMAALGLGAVAAFGAVTAGVAMLGGALWGVGVAILDGFVQTWGTAVGKVMNWWDTITGIFNDSSQSLIEKVWGIGVELVTGFANGIWSLATLPVEAIKNIGIKAADALASALGIHSPSRVTMEMGRNVGRGLAIGTSRTERLVASSSEGLAAAQMSGFDHPMYGPATSAPAALPDAASGGGSGDVSVSIVQHIQGGGDAEETGRIAAREARRELESFFRQVAMEV